MSTSVKFEEGTKLDSGDTRQKCDRMAKENDEKQETNSY